MSDDFDVDKYIEENKHLLEESDEQPSSQPVLDAEGFNNEGLNVDDYLAANAQYLTLDDERSLPQKAVDWLAPKARGAAMGATYGFAPKITAAAESAFTDKTYDQALGESKDAYKKAQEEDPWGYGAAELGGAVLSPINKVGMPVSALKKIKDAEKYARLLKMAQAVGNGAVQGAVAGAGYGDDLGDAGKGALVSGAISGVFPAAQAILSDPAAANTAKKGIENVGKGMQAPEKALDYLAVGIGKVINSIPGIDFIKKEVAPGFFKGNSSNYNSAVAEEYKSIIDGVGRYQSIKSQLGDIAGKEFNSLNDQERLKVYEAMQQSLASRKKDAYKPSIESLQNSVTSALNKNPDAGRRLAGDMVVGTLKNDIAHGLENLKNEFKVYSDPNQADVKALQIRKLINEALNEIDEGTRDRNLNLIKDGQSAYNKKGGFGDLLIDLAETDKIKQSEFNPLDELDEKTVAAAKDKLNSLMIGKKALNIGGAGFGIGSGVMSGLSAGGGAGMIPAGLSVLGGLGRGVEKYGKSIRPEQIADSFIANPSFLKQIANKGGKLGELANDVLKSLQESGIEGAKSKLFLLATDPDFRRMFGVDKSNSNPESQVNSKPWAGDGTPATN